jgi:ATP-dependent Clp protease protease subunit
VPEEAQKADQPKVAEEIWATFCGDVNAANVAKLIGGMVTVSAQGTKRLHILFQSWGGFIGDGVLLYNTLKIFPMEITFYNAGQVASAATLAYLGAHRRKTTANAIFMIHKGSNSPNGAGAGKLKAVAANLGMDDARIESILRDKLRLPEDLWTQFLYHDVFLSGDDAVKYGMADEIGEFSPPAGQSILNALG